jgi:NAD-dependent histone deacetylase SIR2
MRPNIVLYNEAHPTGDIVAEYANHDMKRKPDLLLVCGTSLKVDGIKGLVKSFAGQVRELGGEVRSHYLTKGCTGKQDKVDR